ncbi:hypothetical protein MPTK1_1g13590 [Marchantia polymorpha subsp. ruderalis]|uniref:Major facilitator superfamily (MFS) profile domain-containing protein n=2 Tax=Marchantia polymorpha TaxID=3197 RepID=A0AAF6APS2_MARPO|nr:hypothetical protein MARPO_0019s0129 [Marchantia polymorpha]BBM98442.1 hypothetical protein Mp_1g13590 [Marchantia polymorpha subsp. ruderalis]|eukprot:PTQ44712.1 hypothetical protein MARPO_0019s0129 [Marchantia polymorpha]
MNLRSLAGVGSQAQAHSTAAAAAPTAAPFSTTSASSTSTSTACCPPLLTSGSSVGSALAFVPASPSPSTTPSRPSSFSRLPRPSWASAVGGGGGGGGRSFSPRSPILPSKHISVTVGAHQGRAEEPKPDGDGTLAFPLFRDDVAQWWPMRSRPMADNPYKRFPSREMTTEAERVRAAAAYLAYEVPEYVSTNPPWQLSLPHVCVATIASILFGYHLGVVNVPLDYIAYDLGFAGNALAQGSVVSACLIGAFAGCSTSGSVADKYGRKRAFQISSVPMILGSILSALAPSLPIMLLGRLFVGIGLGIAGPVAALYVSEISPTAVRGTYGSLIQVATCVGILGAILVGLPVTSIPGWWRACFWISTIPAALLALGMEYCAESPRWLFKNSKWLEAEHELERLLGNQHSKTAMADLVRGEEREDSGEASWGALLDRKYLKVVAIGAALFGFQQLAGINAVFYFSSVVFKNAGVTSNIAASVSMGVVNLIASCVATFLMDKQGRRNLMIWSFTGMACAMSLQAAAAGLTVLAPYQGVLSLTATLSYVFMFALGAGPVPALLLPELFANRIRAKAMSVTMCVHWVVNFMVGLFFLQLLQQLGASVVYSFFAAVCVSAALFVRKNVMETKGRSLEEIEIMLLSDDA